MMFQRLRPKKLALCVMFILTFLIWFSGSFIPAYQHEAPILFELNFPGSAAAWQVDAPELTAVESGYLSIRGGPESVHKVSVNCPELSVPAKTKKIKISANVAFTEAGSIPGRTSVLGFWFIDDESTIINYHNISIMPGRYTDTLSSKVVEWPKAATGCAFGLIAHAGGPTITVTDGLVEAVSPNILYQASVALIAFILFLGSYYMICWALQQLTAFQILVTAILASVLIVGVVVSGSSLTKYIHPIYYGVMSLFGISGDDIAGNRTAFDWVFKLGHVIVFALIAFCVFIVRLRINAGLVWALAMLLLIAIASESVQLHVQGRGASLMDVMFDCMGIALGWILAAGMPLPEPKRRKRRHRRRRKRYA